MRWDPNRIESQKLAVHAALLPTNKIVYFSGDEHDPGRHFLAKTDTAHLDTTRVYDCATGSVSAVPSPQVPAGATAPDLFCCGQAFLRDGRLLVAGGTESWTRGHPGDTDPGGHHGEGHFTGLRYAWIFDPEAAPGTNPWKRVADMLPQRGRSVGGGRWYPTLVTTTRGKCLALSGHPSTTHVGEHNNRMVESFDPSPPPLGRWEDRGSVPTGAGGEMLDFAELYPRVHLLPNGEVFSVTPIGNRCRAWRPTGPSTSKWRDVAAAPTDHEYHHIGTTSVLLPLLPQQNYQPQILLCGSAEPIVISPLSAAPAWEPTSGPRQPIRGSASRARIHLNAVILPNMDIMVSGGFDSSGAVKEVELYHPRDDSWTTLPASGTATVARNYHSVALLMPDGRVWTAGGNDGGDWSYHKSAEYENQTPPRPLPTNAQDAGVDNRETEIELFEPAYYGRPDRPRITSVPAFVRYGSSFTISTPDAAVIRRVALIRAGSVTHAFNSDQRYVGLRFTRAAGGLQAIAPPDGNVAPPGAYLLFIVSRIAGEIVPSVGVFVHVGQPFFNAPQMTLAPKRLKVGKKDLMKELAEFELDSSEENGIPTAIRLLANRIQDIEERLDRIQDLIRAGEPSEIDAKVLHEDAEARLAAREVAEAAGRDTSPEKGEPYHPSPAEQIARGLRQGAGRHIEHSNHAPKDLGAAYEPHHKKTKRKKTK